MKKIVISFLSLLMVFSVMNQSVVFASESDSVNFEELTDDELNQKINQSAQAFQTLMDSGVVQYDSYGNVSGINVDKLESLFGVSSEYKELRGLIAKEKENNKAVSGISTRSAGKHVQNFSTCFVKQLLKDFGIYQIRNLIHKGVIDLIGKKQYFKFVQKVAQIAVKKLGKKAAAKIVSAATPAGWAIHAWKAGLWSYRCTVEYDRWA